MTVSAPPADVADVAEAEALDARELMLVAKLVAALLRLEEMDEILLASEDCMLDILEEIDDWTLGAAVAASELRDESSLAAPDVTDE